jgi:hypothetical protein
VLIQDLFSDFIRQCLQKRKFDSSVGDINFGIVVHDGNALGWNRCWGSISQF